MNFDFSWFLTIPGMLITGGVLLLIIALIVLIVSGKKDKKEKKLFKKNPDDKLLKEIEELRKEFKIKDEGWRHLVGITMIAIKDNKVIGSVPKRYIEQLEYMGYDTNVLEYELKEEE